MRPDREADELMRVYRDTISISTHWAGWGQAGASGLANAQQQALANQAASQRYDQLAAMLNSAMVESKTLYAPEPLTVTESTETIIGYRLWEIRVVGRVVLLESLNTHTLWPVGEPCEAHALSQHNTNSHDGIHAFKTAQTEHEYRTECGIPDQKKGFIAYGKVALWGHVIEHEHGYRAQYAYPLSIVVLEDAPNAEALARALANTYGCEASVG